MNGCSVLIASTRPDFSAVTWSGNGIATSLTLLGSPPSLAIASLRETSQLPCSEFTATLLPSSCLNDVMPESLPTTVANAVCPSTL